MPTSSPWHLHAVPASATAFPEHRCSVATRAVMAGPQSVRVTAMTPQATGRSWGHLCLRVGRVLICLDDRDSLGAWQEALRQAEEMVDAALGPVMPPGGTIRGRETTASRGAVLCSASCSPSRPEQALLRLRPLPWPPAGF